MSAGAIANLRALDGGGYRQLVVAGADWVRSRREHLNSINVFPVPDGDTGTNMALSLSAAASAVRASDAHELHVVARQVAEGCTLGAKGNSGVILAQWFLSLSRAFDEQGAVTLRETAAALSDATASVYRAVETPVEGTILSVMRAVSERSAVAAGHAQTLVAFVEALLDAGNEALARTPEQLAVLREAAVVDAGAQGFVDFLTGALRALRGEPALPPDAAALEGGATHDVSLVPDEVGERYCTEVVIRGTGLDEERMREALAGLGSSMLVVSTGEVAKVHVHTDHPDEAIGRVARFGEVIERKVDDMLAQARERSDAAITPVLPLDEQPGTIAVLCDSTADLPAGLRAELGIEMAPLQILFGDEVFRDQVDMSTEDFYRRMARDPHVRPTTSQPPPRAFVEALDRVRRDREALVLCVHEKLSGTARSAAQAARLCAHPRIEVRSSGSASLGTGLIAINAARYAASGATMDELLGWVDRWRTDTHSLFALDTLEYLRRGGRIGRGEAAIGGLLGVRPLLGVDADGVCRLGKARGRAGVAAKARERIAGQIPAGARIRVGLLLIPSASATADSAGRQALEGATHYLADRYDVIESRQVVPTGAVGVHTGPGSWGIIAQTVRDNDPLLDH